MEKTNDILQDAKQGNPKAIEAIFNKQLKAKNIAVKAVVRDGCLQIMFEAKQALSQVTMVNGVKKVLTGIKPENIQTVKVYSKQLGDDFPKWHEEFELAEKKKVDVSPNIDLVQIEAPKPSETINPSSDSNKSLSQAKNRTTKPSELIDTNAKPRVNDLTSNLTSPNIADEDSLLLEKARWGDLGSISTLLNSAFSSKGISVSLNMRRAKSLGIALESNDILDKQIAVKIICRNLNKTKTKVFDEVFVSINTLESNVLFWTQNLIFKDNQFIEKEDVVVDSPELIDTNAKSHVNYLTKKSISIFSGVLATCIILSWFGWTLYQRSTYENLLTSAQKITANVSNNTDSENLDARQKDIDTAFLLLYKIPSDSGDIYQRAKKTSSDLTKLNFQNAKLYGKRGATRLGVDNQGAIEDFDKAITYNPNYAEAYFARAATQTLIVRSERERGQQVNLQGVRPDLQKAVELFGQQENVKMQSQAQTVLKELDELIASIAKEDANKALANQKKEEESKAFNQKEEETSKALNSRYRGNDVPETWDMYFFCQANPRALVCGKR